jgi:excisionase family DNA binding protein
MSSRYLTAREAAEYLGVTYRGFDVWVRRHGVPCVRYGRVRKFTRESLDAVLRTMELRAQQTGSR